MKNIIFLGGPGSGKDTQIEKLKEDHGFEVISSGDIIREKAQSDEKIGEIVKSGKLLDDGTTISLIKDKLESIEAENNVIFNGFPRNVGQAKHLDAMLKNLGRSLDKVIYLEVSDDEIVERLGKRIYCVGCGEKSLMSKDECMRCGGEVEKREDDTRETILKRIGVYHDKTEPLIEYYKELLLKIDGEKSVDGVFDEIKSKLELR